MARVRRRGGRGLPVTPRARNPDPIGAGYCRRRAPRLGPFGARKAPTVRQGAARATPARLPDQTRLHYGGEMTVAVHATERRKFAPPKAFVEILGGGCAHLPFFVEPRLNMPRYTKVISADGVPVTARFAIPSHDPGARPGPGQRSQNREAPDANHPFGASSCRCIGIITYKHSKIDKIFCKFYAN